MAAVVGVLKPLLLNRFRAKNTELGQADQGADGKPGKAFAGPFPIGDGKVYKLWVDDDGELWVAGRVAVADPPALAWVFGGLLAVLAPPALVLTAGWFASRGPRDP